MLSLESVCGMYRAAISMFQLYKVQSVNPKMLHRYYPHLSR